MCGRFDFHGDAIDIEKAFGLGGFTQFWTPRYNLAPSETAPVIVGSDATHPVVVPARFGWRPEFMRGGLLLNARSETVRQRASFRKAVERHRCIVVANGFFEWDKSTRPRTPWYFTSASHRVFGLAGLLEPGTAPAPDAFVILTTGANDTIAEFHKRMPVMMAPADALRYLTVSTPEATDMLRPYPASDMQRHRVSVEVNRAGYEGPNCIAPQEPFGS